MTTPLEDMTAERDHWRRIARYSEADATRLEARAKAVEKERDDLRAAINPELSAVIARAEAAERQARETTVALLRANQERHEAQVHNTKRAEALQAASEVHQAACRRLILSEDACDALRRKLTGAEKERDSYRDQLAAAENELMHHRDGHFARLEKARQTVADIHARAAAVDAAPGSVRIVTVSAEEAAYAAHRWSVLGFWISIFAVLVSALALVLQ